MNQPMKTVFWLENYYKAADKCVNNFHLNQSVMKDRCTWVKDGGV